MANCHVRVILENQQLMTLTFCFSSFHIGLCPTLRFPPVSWGTWFHQLPSLSRTLRYPFPAGTLPSLHLQTRINLSYRKEKRKPGLISWLPLAAPDFLPPLAAAPVPSSLPPSLNTCHLGPHCGVTGLAHPSPTCSSPDLLLGITPHPHHPD